MKLNFEEWVANNKHLLVPPVSNHLLFAEDGFVVMAVGGPNQRSDYHINPTPEFFHQHIGTLTLKTIQDRKHVNVVVSPGEMFMLPSGISHCP